jgi:hypothetical protein
MKPITPQEASQQRQTQIPDFVIDCFNKLIAKNYRNGRARVIQNEVMLEILATDADLTRQTVFDNGWLDVEEVYRAAGWRVEYAKPAYNETYDAFFVFSK